MSNITGYRIREERERLGLTQNQLAQKLQFPDSSYISKMEKGIRKVTPEELILLAKLYGCSPQYLLGISNEKISKEDVSKTANNVPSGADKNEVKILPGGVKMIPVYNLTSRDGNEIIAQDNRIGEVPISATIMADIAILMDNDSMFPGIKEGAYVIVRKQKTFTNGQAVLAQLPDGSYTVRRATQTNGGIILTPENQAFPPQHFNAADIHIIGIIVQVSTNFI